MLEGVPVEADLLALLVALLLPPLASVNSDSLQPVSAAPTLAITTTTKATTLPHELSRVSMDRQVTHVE